MEKKKKILIVDDEKDFTEMIRWNLEATGRYEVRSESKGAKALAAAREFRPHLILLDIIIPDMDGGEILFQLKNDAVVKDIPLVFLTAIVTQPEVNSVGSLISGHPSIAKPVSAADLIAYIKKTIG